MLTGGGTNDAQGSYHADGIVRAGVSPGGLRPAGSPCAHAHPASLHVVKGALGMPLTPFLSREEKEKGIGANVLFDATFPYHWAPEERPTVVDFQHAWPAGIREKVLAKWEEYGIGPS